MSIHIFGCHHPLCSYIQSHHTSNSEVILYTRTPGCGEFHYDLLFDKISSGDILISLMPIYNFSLFVLTNQEKFKLLSTLHIISLSSSSIFSKLTAKSYDKSLYIHFLNGELNMTRFIDLFPNFKLCILRLSMIWGNNSDKNISRLYHIMNKYHIMLFNSNCNGRRAPLHYSDLALVIRQIIVNSVFPSGTFTVMGKSVLTYRQMVSLIISSTSLSDKLVYSIFIPSILIKAFLAILHPFRIMSLVSILSMLDRQSSDLVFNTDSIYTYLDKAPEFLDFKSHLNLLSTKNSL